MEAERRVGVTRYISNLYEVAKATQLSYACRIALDLRECCLPEEIANNECYCFPEEVISG